MMKALDVTWISDSEIQPPGPKMVICVEPHIGLYFRINSNDNWEPCIPILRIPDHPFLKWDSFIECTILEIDDYIINQALRKSGVIGTISKSLCDPLIKALGYASGSRRDKNAIITVLERMR
ncbi:MAG: hypothetical protein RLZZ444_2371 [Pseudomonadota bacterium]|jgi:hypothetical protein